MGGEGASRMWEEGGFRFGGSVGASQKKTWGQGWAKKKMIIKLLPEKKN
jgi:hypothetical protein